MKIVLSWSFARQHLAIEWLSVGHDLGTVWLRVCAEVWFLKEQEKVDEWLLAGDCCTKCSIEAVFRVTGEVSSVGCNYDKWPRSQLRCPFESFMRELFSIRKEKKTRCYTCLPVTSVKISIQKATFLCHFIKLLLLCFASQTLRTNLNNTVIIQTPLENCKIKLRRINKWMKA